MADAWARFVEAGDPNGGALPRWPAFTGTEAMLFGTSGEGRWIRADSPHVSPFLR